MTMEAEKQDIQYHQKYISGQEPSMVKPPFLPLLICFSFLAGV